MNFWQRIRGHWSRIFGQDTAETYARLTGQKLQGMSMQSLVILYGDVPRGTRAKAELERMIRENASIFDQWRTVYLYAPTDSELFEGAFVAITRKAKTFDDLISLMPFRPSGSRSLRILRLAVERAKIFRDWQAVFRHAGECEERAMADDAFDKMVQTADSFSQWLEVLGLSLPASDVRLRAIREVSSRASDSSDWLKVYLEVGSSDSAIAELAKSEMARLGRHVDHEGREIDRRAVKEPVEWND